MQLNTTTALTTALLSAIIGFGLAFYIERKLSSRMQRKSQKILTYIAMTSFGYGLMGSLNEVIGFPLQGLQIRYDKLAGLVILNMVFLPIIFIAIAKIIKPKNKSIDTDFNVQSNSARDNYFKYILILAGASSIAYFGYVALDEDASVATYDFYERKDYKNCYSPYESTPSYSLKFQHKKETGEIFVTAEYELSGVRKTDIQKFDGCSVLDAKNWTCGGEWSGSIQFAKYTFVNGKFTYDAGVSPLKESANCPPKIVKR